MRINTNVNAINAQRNLNSVGSALGKSIERLSSGLRINRAGDDAAGLTISEKLRAQTKGLNQAVRNAQDGISMIQTAEGGLNETHTILQRMRELAVQGANDTLTDTDRGAIGSELNSLKSEINRIATDTDYNSKRLLNGGMSTSLAGAAGTDLINGEMLTTATLAVSSVSVSGAAQNNTYTLSAAGTSGLTLTATVGGATISQSITLSAMTSSAASVQTLDFNTLGVKVNLSGFSASGTIANIITDLTATANDTIVTASGSAAAAFQVGSNANQTVSVGITASDSASIGNAGGFGSLSAGVAAFVAGSTTTNAQNLILSLDKAIADVSTNRSNLGAVQNRLEHSIENLATSSENLTASESRIRDADMASEMVTFTRNNILSQAGTSILAQANQLPQGVLSLLR